MHQFCTDECGVFWPVVLIAVGVLVLLHNLGLLPAEAWRYWPVIVVIVGLVKLSEVQKGSKKK